VEIGVRLSASVREDDCVGASSPTSVESVSRLASDEFSVLLEAVSDPSDALRVANRIQQVLGEPLGEIQSARTPTVSIGIALISGKPASCEDVLRDLDGAMRRAKARGGNCCEVSDHVLHARAIRRLTQEAELRTALEQRQFSIYYQPVVWLSNQQVAGFEALLRWQHPMEGLISPLKFIETAEGSGLLVEIGTWLVGEICHTVRAWEESCELPANFAVSVNLSSRQLADAGLIGRFLTALAKSQIDALRLQIEIAESAAMRNPAQTEATLAELRHAGIVAALDNFGAGPCSLRLLTQLSLKSIKLDRSLVQGMQSDRSTAQLVTMIVSAARTAGLEVIGEGLENHFVIEKLRRLGCELGQGFLFSQPLSSEGAGRLLVARVPR
jgi:EAL domain-containing protein (putative c-di-GMP-specific phosphodiesterase class I)